MRCGAAGRRAAGLVAAMLFAACGPADGGPAAPPAPGTAAALVAGPQPGVPDSKGTGSRADYKAQFIKRFVDKPAPPFRLKGADGRDRSLADYRGKVVLLNFWFSACFPCREETPDLIALYNLHRDRGLVVLGINTDALMMPDAGDEPMRSFMQTYRVPYPVLVADHDMYRLYGNPPVQPISFLVDRRGVVAQIFWGARPGAVFDRAVRPHLAAGATACIPPSPRRDSAPPPPPGRWRGGS